MVEPRLLADLAIEAIAAGYSVVPPAEDGTKRPLTEWKRYQSERATKDTIDAWYANGRTGIGIVCGAVSGNLEMLEFEGRALDEGLHTAFLDASDAAGLGPLLDRIVGGYQEATPSGGLHLLYRIDGPVAGNTKLARRPATDVELAANPDEKIQVLIETRGEGGYVIVAPSSGAVHPSGRPWQQVTGSLHTVATITPAERNELHRLARLFDTMPTPTVDPSASIPSRGTTPGPGDDLRPGDRYNADPDAASKTLELLAAHGWTAIFRRGNDIHLRRPGKPIGTSAVLHMDSAVLVVFSTSTTFEAEKGYSPFAVYTHLQHGDDWTAATRALAGPSNAHDDLSWATSGATGAPGDAVGQSTVPAALSGAQEEPPSPKPTSWTPVDLAHIRRGELPPPPVELTRNDHVSLLYAGKVNSIFGESESMKSWAAMLAAAQRLDAGGHVLWVDFEDDATVATTRLTQLGVPWERIEDGFHYLRPDEPLVDGHGRYTAAHADLQEAARGWPHALVVLDGVTEALNLHGWSSDSGDDYAHFNRVLARALADLGPAVATIDHVTKNRETRGKYAIGSQHKRATISGAALQAEMTAPFGLGRHGTLKLTIAKDKPGHLRRHAAGGLVAEMHLDSDQATGRITYEVRAPSVERVETGAWDGPTECIAAVLQWFRSVPDDAVSKRQVADQMRGRGLSYRDTTVSEALERLAATGRLEVRSGPRKSRLFALPDGADMSGSMLDQEAF